MTCKISPREDNNDQYYDEYFPLSLSLWNRAGRASGGSKELIGRSDRFDYFSFSESHVTDTPAEFISRLEMYRRYFANYVMKLKKKIIHSTMS